MTEENAQTQEPIELKPGDNPAAVVTAAAPVEPPKEQLKIIMTFRDGGALIGIQRPDCDPVLSKVEGTLSSILSAVPRLITAADQKWKSQSGDDLQATAGADTCTQACYKSCSREAEVPGRHKERRHSADRTETVDQNVREGITQYCLRD
ncbi:MAG: hypothetical protein HYX81_04845 [Chloroflexi bacterium]|nr:hypothetical protein [Chloroflexota bacterium]